MKYLKAFVTLVVSTAGALIVALGPGGNSLGDLDTTHWLVAALTILGSAGVVWFVENVPGVAGGIIKTAVAFLSAGIASLVVALNDNVISQSEWLIAFTAAVTATGLVYQARNIE